MCLSIAGGANSIDNAAVLHYSCGVRWLPLLILVALLHDIFAPHQITLSGTPDGQPAVVTLDVCRASGYQAAVDNEITEVNCSPGDMMPVLSVGSSAPLGSLFHEYLLVLQSEHPPEAP